MGDLLPPTIYIPYLKMLQGLASGPQCAHYCFSLLKVNGSGHGRQSLVACRLVVTFWGSVSLCLWKTVGYL